MIRVGDTVRYTNEYLNSIGSYWDGHKYCKGKQNLMKVIDVLPSHWNWRAKRFDQCVRLSNEEIINTHWLRFVRRPKFKKTQEYKQYCKDMFG